jgi:N-acetylglutamate synthase-like GNAT family acetyltransferase
MTHADIMIRQANDSDGPELLALIRIAMAVYARNSGISTVLDAQRETLDDLLVHLKTDHVLVAEHRGRLIGTVRLILAEDGSAYFSRFAVLPALQQSGVGKLLYQRAEEWLRGCGVQTIRLHTALTNQPLVAFYRSRGFELVETKTARGYPRGLFEKKLTGD